MKLGIGSYTYPWAIGVPGHPPKRAMTGAGLIERASSLGVRVVQFADNLPLTGLGEAELTALERQAEACGIGIELGTRGIREEALKANLLLAVRFRAPFVRVVIDSAGDEPSPAEVVERLGAVAGAYRAAGVSLAIENHDRFRSCALKEIVEALGVDWVGICLDTVNSFGALEGPEVVVRTLAPYTLNVHLKDFTIRRVSSQMGFVVEGCVAGDGRLDVAWLLRQFEASRRRLSAILELWTPSNGALEETIAREGEWAERSVRQLRAWISE